MVASCGRKNYAYFSASRAGHTAVENRVPSDADSLVAKINAIQNTISSFDTSSLATSPLVTKAIASIAKSKSSKAAYKSELRNAKIGKLLKASLKNKAISNREWYSRGKSQLVATLLCFFFGLLGIHRFYLGYTWQGFVQLLLFLLLFYALPLLLGLFIWWLIDLIRIIIGELEPKDGPYGDIF
jgi:TM2 domain-containing membrane protein YozV